MSGTILPSYGPRTFGVPAKTSGAKPTGIQSTSFGDMAARASKADAYKKYLEKRFGPVTVQSVGKDRASLEAAGKRMRGNDIVIAPNIFEEMVSDPQKAACYEQKISYFFTDVIPKGTAWAASVGLTFEPCGVVIHEDGTVTYICGGGWPKSAGSTGRRPRNRRNSSGCIWSRPRRRWKELRSTSVICDL